MAVNEIAVATIANGASLSDAVDAGILRLFAIQMPGSWTAADLTLQASADGSTYGNVYDEADTEVVVEADASRFIILDPAKFLGMRYIKLRSGTAGSAVNQGAERLIKVVLTR